MDPATDGARIRARLGAVPQEDSLDLELTVRENVLIYGRYFGLPRPVIRERADELLDFVQLTDRSERPGRRPVRRHEAPAHDRPGARERARPGAARRADHRSRPAGPPPRLGAALPAQAAGRDARADHALHGRGRAAVRPARDHGRRRDRRRRVAAPADRRTLDPRGRRAALRLGRRPGRRRSRSSRAPGSRTRRSPTASSIYTADGEQEVEQLAHAGVHPESVLVRRSSLEDVFLRLTGRTLEE